MPIFEYFAFMCNQSELQALLTEAGLNRWRLHTCDPVVTMGPQGSGILQAFVVMDRMLDESEDPIPDVLDDDDQPGLAMKG